MRLVDAHGAAVGDAGGALVDVAVAVREVVDGVAVDGRRDVVRLALRVSSGGSSDGRGGSGRGRGRGGRWHDSGGGDCFRGENGESCLNGIGHLGCGRDDGAHVGGSKRGRIGGDRLGGSDSRGRLGDGGLGGGSAGDGGSVGLDVTIVQRRRRC